MSDTKRLAMVYSSTSQMRKRTFTRSVDLTKRELRTMIWTCWRKSAVGSGPKNCCFFSKT